MKFYVYVYRDPRPSKNNAPVYVGKGHGTRDMDHWVHGSHNKPLQDFNSHLRQAGLVPLVARVFETDVESEAFTEEVRLIALYGRRNTRTGTLFNLTDGGEGGVGVVKTDAHKETDRNNSLEHWKDPTYRTKVIARQVEGNARPEVKAKRSENSQAVWAEQGASLAAKIGAARNTDASKAKTSAQAITQWADPEYRAKMELIKKEIDARPEVSEARSSKLKDRWGDPVKRAERQASMKAAAKARAKPIHAMPINKTFSCLRELREQTAMVPSTAHILLKGGEMKQGKFKGWTLQYV